MTLRPPRRHSTVRALGRVVLAGALLVGLTAAWLSRDAARGEQADAAQTPPAAGNDAQANRPDLGASRVAWVFRVTLPITGETARQVRQFIQKALDRAAPFGEKPVLVFEFHVPPDQRDFARTSEFGSSYDLARELSSDRLAKATTVAFVPESIQGHAVLVALACEWIVMAPEAEIGQAGVNEQRLTPAVYSAYQEIVGRRKKVPVEVALGMLDPAREVFEVETKTSREYVTPEGLSDLRNRLGIEGEPKVLFARGEPGRLAGKQARELDFIDYLASDRRGLAQSLGLPHDALQEDPSLTAPWRWAVLDLKGPIDARAVSQAQLQIEQAIRRWEINFVCVRIDSPGGSLEDSVQLANFLALDLDPSKVRTVAYVEKEALADAALVALACDRVVMHPNAVLGGEGAAVFSEVQIEQARGALRNALAGRTTRSWSLPAATIDPKLAVFQYTRLGKVAYTDYFCQQEWAEQPDRDDWKQGPQVTTRGRPFQVDAQRAVQYRLAADVAGDFAGFKAICGLEGEPILLKTGWAHFLIDSLADSRVAFALLVIAFVATWVEMHTPGMGVAGFLAMVCFVLFFWSRFLGGTAGWLEVMLFAAGVACLLLEVFVLPGFGIFGLGGGLLILISLILASQTFVLPANSWQVTKLRDTFLSIAGAGAAVIVLGALLNRWLPNVPLFGGVVLRPPSEEEVKALRERESLVHFEGLLGARGKTTTRLAPGGKARFGDRLVDVMAEGELIPAGTEVIVEEVLGNRVLVRPLEEGSENT